MVNRMRPGSATFHFRPASFVARWPLSIWRTPRRSIKALPGAREERASEDPVGLPVECAQVAAIAGLQQEAGLDERRDGGLAEIARQIAQSADLRARQLQVRHLAVFDLNAHTGRLRAERFHDVLLASDQYARLRPPPCVGRETAVQ